MPFTFQTTAALALFAALILTLTLYGLAATGHFPRKARRPEMTGALATLILWGSVAVASVCAGVGIVAAWPLVPWTAAIIAGGLAVLIAPLVLQLCPDSFVDGCGALVGFSGATAAIALGLLMISPLAA